MGEARRGRQLVSGAGRVVPGYSRAVRVGETVHVAGTAAYKDGEVYAPGDAAAQTRQILAIIEQALTEAGATLADVVRYRIYVTNVADCEVVADEVAKVFAAVRPAGTLVVVSALIDPALVVEIEVDAIIGSG